MKRKSTIILTVLICIAILLPVSTAAQQHGGTLSHLKLRGTIFTKSLKPLAIIEDTRTGQIMMYEDGESLEGAQITHIARGEVVLMTTTGRHRLTLPTGRVLQPGAAATKDTDKWYNIRRSGNTFYVDKDTVSDAVRRIMSIMKNVTIRPSYTNGNRSGIVVSRLTPEGVLRESGIQQGDVIKGINGHTLNSPHQVFRAYRKTINQREIRLNIVRNNTPITLTYKIKK